MSDFSIDDADVRLLELLQEDASRSNLELAELAHVSPATSQRRIRRLQSIGLVERQVALLNPERLAEVTGHGLTAILEITLASQTEEVLGAFENAVAQDPVVQQLYRVSPGPDFVAIVHVEDMPAYLALSKRLLNEQAQVRNVKAYFSVKRSKFEPRLPVNKRAAKD